MLPCLQAKTEAPMLDDVPGSGLGLQSVNNVGVQWAGAEHTLRTERPLKRASGRHTVLGP